MKPTESSFLYFYHSDMANAAIHMSPVKFSPITFALAMLIDGPDSSVLVGPQTFELVREVMAHVGQYPLDTGR